MLGKSRWRYPAGSVQRAVQLLSTARPGVLFFLTIVVVLLLEETPPAYVLALYLIDLTVSIVGVVPQRLPQPLRSQWPAVQVILDFVLVASTVHVTGGPSSLFTSIFIMVVLESGILLGMAFSLTVSTCASIFMLSQIFLNAQAAARRGDPAELLYDFLVQTLGFYLTAFMAGYWSQRLRQIQSFQRDILDNMSSGFLITDHLGNVTASNRAAGTILRTQDKLSGRPVQEIVCDASGGESPIMTALRSGRDYTSYEFTAITHDGGRKLLGLTTNRMYEGDGAVSGIIASFTDLTEMNRMRQEVRRQDRMAAIGELSAGLAHEIRNPVAVIRGAADEMQRHPDNDSIQQRLRKMIVRESDQLNEIVTGFLDFAREPVLKREAIDVVSLLAELRESLMQEIQNGNARWTIDLNAPSSSTFVTGDASQLRQVFVNLAKNGLESMDSGGTLQITVEGGDGKPVTVRFDDQGPGIPPDQVARIFEPFYTTKRAGVGMGLAVCARILTAHDGTIRVTSRTGGGCSMNVTLPAVSNHEGARRE